jgi:Family of unknown function (DUF6491)
MLKRIVAVGLAAVMVVLAGSAEGQSCFRSGQWTTWTAPNEHTLYLKVGLRVFRLDLARPCTGLHTGASLVTHSHSGQYCKAIDWSLAVRRGGVTHRCIVSNMTQLTPDEIAALPKDVRP